MRPPHALSAGRLAALDATRRSTTGCVVSVVGADTLGGAIVHKIASRGRFREVRLIDAAEGAAAGQALDVQQAGAVERFHTRVTAHAGLDAAVGAAVIVLAGAARPAPDGGGASEDAAEGAGLDALGRLHAVNRRAVFVCAGASHRRLVGRAVAELKIPRRQVIGSSPAALQSAIRAIAALEARCSAAEIALAVLGAPPEHLVVPWSEATARGLSLSRALEPPRLARLRERAHLVWPPGPYALASATARICEAVAVGPRLRGASCSVVLDGELGARGVPAAVTVELGPAGVSRILEPALTGQEQVRLETALLAG